jgi:hypothetical protein
MRWVVANGFSEALGLGLSLLLTGFLFSQLDDLPIGVAATLSLVGAGASGSIEATIVGLAQWWAMSPWFPQIQRRSWWLATLWGALFAYLLGYLPSTIMSMMQPGVEGTASVSEPPQVIVLFLAAGLGAVAGAVLSFAQYLVMRQKIRLAGIWIPANMLAWIVGMPVVFGAIDVAYRMTPLWKSIGFMAFALLITGGIVGAIHGVGLVKIAQRNDIHEHGSKANLG